MRVGNHIFASILIWSCLYFNATFVVSFSGAHAQEAPPFRAWWPIVNLEVEVGGRGFYAMDPSESKDGENIKSDKGFGTDPDERMDKLRFIPLVPFFLVGYSF